MAQFTGTMARSLKRDRTDNFGQEHLGCRITMKDVVLAALFIIQHKLHGDTGIVRPGCMRRRRPIADHVTRIAHPPDSVPDSGTPSDLSMARQLASMARSSFSTQMTLLGGMACDTATCQ